MRTIFLTFAILLSILSICTPQCTVYKCNNSTDDCKVYSEEDGSYSIKKCKTIDQKCNFDETTKKGTCQYLPASLPAGEKCVNDTVCISGKCSGGVCQGKKETEDCENTDDCNIGLYCKDKKCKKVLAVNDTCTMKMNVDMIPYVMMENVKKCFHSHQEHKLQAVYTLFCVRQTR